MLKKILLVVVALIAVLVVVILMQPATYGVERSATMKAPPEAVYAQVADFRKWEAWSPWAHLDPAAKNTFEGPASGTGAIFAWDGNDEIGAGKMTILEAKSPEVIRIRLEFFRPFESAANTNFHFAPGTDGTTTVRWSMDGENNFIGKAFGLVMDFDSMIGKDYDKGLANIKAIVEAKSSK